jgi:GNAT superfamily N-acetyltransferase
MLIELAEEPNLWLPPEPSQAILKTGRYTLVTRGRSAAVVRIRLGADEVVEAIEEVRALLHGGTVTDAVWWVGDRSTPDDIASRLARFGLTPADPPQLTTFGITHEPAGRPTADVRRVETLEEFLQALEIDWKVFAVPAGELDERRRAAVEAWPSILEDGSSSTYIASLDGRPAGFARAVFTPAAALLMGGATLPEARGRGVYSSTVHARWREAVERGVPRIAVSAGAMSGPVLARLGFVPLGRVDLLRDHL